MWRRGDRLKETRVTIKSELLDQKTSKGEVAIPKEIRDYLQLDTGHKIDFVIDRDGKVKLIPLNIPVEILSGILHCPGRKKATIEGMETGDRLREVK